MRAKILLFIQIALVVIILALSVRGLPGNPDTRLFNDNDYKAHGALELSPERGRFALVYSMVEDKSLSFSVDVARFVTPDVAYHDGKYVSLFAPGVSFLVLPGYLIGRYFDASQVGTFSVIAFFAFLNALLVVAIARYLGAGKVARWMGAITFLFATPAFAYATTLYQHHISVFIILSSLYLVLRFKSIWSLLLIWMLIASSLLVDYPNAMLLAPIGLYAVFKNISVKSIAQKIQIKIKPLHILAVVSALIPIMAFLLYNTAAYGSPLQLAGTLKSVDFIDANGKPGMIDKTSDQKLTTDEEFERAANQSSTAFFQTRNLLNGFYTHFLSPDRGLIYFTPVVFFGILGGLVLYRKNQTAFVLIASTIGVNVVLYSMWGDPWGGWAFGSRYLIPTYALSGILIALALTNYRQKKVFVALFAGLLVYSLLVNTLGALTTSKVPPKNQVLQLEQLSGKEEKYTYERNIDFLVQKGPNSFVYKKYEQALLTPVQYYILVVGVIITLCAVVVLPGMSLRKIYSQFKK